MYQARVDLVQAGFEFAEAGQPCGLAFDGGFQTCDSRFEVGDLLGRLVLRCLGIG